MTKIGKCQPKSSLPVWRPLFNFVASLLEEDCSKEQTEAAPDEV